jgi:hypothetical protein
MDLRHVDWLREANSGGLPVRSLGCPSKATNPTPKPKPNDCWRALPLPQVPATNGLPLQAATRLPPRHPPLPDYKIGVRLLKGGVSNSTSPAYRAAMPVLTVPAGQRGLVAERERVLSSSAVFYRIPGEAGLTTSR